MTNIPNTKYNIQKLCNFPASVNMFHMFPRKHGYYLPKQH
jgi:hypothetical protein